MIDLNVLPVGKQFENLQKLLISSSCVAVKAPTGSGKSIGLPLMIMKKGLVGGQILVVQPRRIAARLLARSVSKINGTQIGEEIGYQVRFENKSNPHTKIVYVTDGILLQKILHDSMLSRIGCVIFDEFHERSIQMDTSLALVHRLISNGRPSLKVVVTSATLDLKKIENYLPNCRSIELNSRIHPVEIVHRHTSGNEVPQIIDELSKQVDQRDGDILIFMDGVAEIGKLVREIKKKPWAKGILVFPFHGEMPIDEQEKVLFDTEKRKIIVSTNLAETSITIEGIKIVIDTGKVKKYRFDYRRGVNVLLSDQISKSSAEQRAGRAGRTTSGICVRLWSKSFHDRMLEFEIPEILRIDLSEVLLNLKAVGLKLMDLQWIDLPTESSIQNAENCLFNLSLTNQYGEILSEGHKLAKLPMHPRLSVFLTKGKKHGCLPATSLILSLMEGRLPLEKESLQDFCLQSQVRIKEGFYSDLWGLLEAYSSWSSKGFQFEESKKKGIHHKRFKDAQKLADHYCSLMGETLDFEFPSYEVLMKILIEVFPFRICRLKSRARNLYENNEGTGVVRNQSPVNLKANWVLALDITEKNRKGRIVLVMGLVSEIKERWIVEVLSEKLSFEKKINLDLETRNVSSQSFNTMGVHKFNFKESFEVNENERAQAFAVALCGGDLKLKNWNRQVTQFIARTNFVNRFYSKSLIGKFDDKEVYRLFYEICLKERTWKAIKNSNVYSYLLQIHKKDEISFINKFAPAQLFLFKDRKPFSLEYKNDEVFLSAKIQDLYDLKIHPTILCGEFRVTLSILGPNNLEVQRTQDIHYFWESSYVSIKKELARRYPKHEWR